MEHGDYHFGRCPAASKGYAAKTSKEILFPRAYLAVDPVQIITMRWICGSLGHGERAEVALAQLLEEQTFPLWPGKSGLAL
jgi:hypothetical protein